MLQEYTCKNRKKDIHCTVIIFKIKTRHTPTNLIQDCDHDDNSVYTDVIF